MRLSGRRIVITRGASILLVCVIASVFNANNASAATCSPRYITGGVDSTHESIRAQIDLLFHSNTFELNTQLPARPVAPKRCTGASCSGIPWAPAVPPHAGAFEWDKGWACLPSWPIQAMPEAFPLPEGSRDARAPRDGDGIFHPPRTSLAG